MERKNPGLSMTTTDESRLRLAAGNIARMMAYRDERNEKAVRREEIDSGIEEVIQGAAYFTFGVADGKVLVFVVKSAKVSTHLDAFPKKDDPVLEGIGLVLFVMMGVSVKAAVKTQIANKIAEVGLRRYQTFDVQSLTFDPTAHALNADVHHAVVTAPEELAEVRSKFRDLQKLPFLRTSDPIAMWIGAAHGQVVRKTWNSGHREYLLTVSA